MPINLIADGQDERENQHLQKKFSRRATAGGVVASVSAGVAVALMNKYPILAGLSAFVAVTSFAKIQKYQLSSTIVELTTRIARVERRADLLIEESRKRNAGPTAG